MLFSTRFFKAFALAGLLHAAMILGMCLMIRYYSGTATSTVCFKSPGDDIQQHQLLIQRAVLHGRQLILFALCFTAALGVVYLPQRWQKPGVTAAVLAVLAWLFVVAHYMSITRGLMFSV